MMNLWVANAGSVGVEFGEVAEDLGSRPVVEPLFAAHHWFVELESETRGPIVLSKEVTSDNGGRRSGLGDSLLGGR